MNIETTIKDALTEIQNALDAFNEENTDIYIFYPSEIEMNLSIGDESYVRFTLSIEDKSEGESK